jgi:hypothetical protein
MAKQNGTRTQAPAPSYKIVYGIVKRGESSFWTRIGAAFENRDVMRSPALCGVRELVGLERAARAGIYSA